MSRVDDRIVEAFRLIDSCAVSDAMDKLGLDSQVVSGLAAQSAARRIVGRAVTVKLVAATEGGTAAGPPRHLGSTAIEAALPGDVIVVEQRTGLNAGCWGGLLSLGAKVRGVSGVVADGPVRDIDEARGYDLPVYCNALTARTARGRVVEAATNEPVRIGDVTVQPGDVVVADGSGVAIVPAGRAEEVLQVARGIAAKEALMAKALLDGTPISQVMGADYEHMLN